MVGLVRRDCVLHRVTVEYWGFSSGEGLGDRRHLDTLEHLLVQVAVADAGGMDGWFFAEHHCRADYSLTTSPNLLVAAASQRAPRIRLGSMVNVLPYHHPLRAAEEIRLLDAMTGGRLEVGFGRGGTPHEHAAWGIDSGDGRRRFDAALELVMRFLTEESVDYETPWWRGRGATVVPEPTQRPTPPLWLAIVSDATLRRAAELGFGCSAAFCYPELLRARLAAYRDAWEEHHPGIRPGRFGISVQVAVGETWAEAVRYAREPIEERIALFTQVFGRAAANGGPEAASVVRLHQRLSALTFEGLIDDGLIVFGSVEQCAEQLDQLAAAGIDVLIAHVQVGGMDPDYADRSLRLLCQEVIPRVTRREAAMAPATE